MTNTKIFFWVSKIFTDFSAILIAWILGYFLRLKWDFLPFIQTDLPQNFPEINFLFLFFLLSSLWFLLISWLNWQYKFETWKSRLKSFFEILYNLILWCLLIIAFYALLKHELFFSRIYLFQVFILKIIFFSHRCLWRMFMTNVEYETCWWQLQKSKTWRKKTSPILWFCHQHIAVAEKTYIAFDLEKSNSIVPSQIDISWLI